MATPHTTIHTIKLGDQHYPPLLSQIHQPPKTLFVRGNLDALLNTNTIAIVGTRKATRYGSDSCNAITTALTKAHFTIISGLALGIDSVAHQATLDAQGTTIAVLGTGVADPHITPHQHFQLAHRIMAQGGAILSEYPPSSSFGRHTFAARNRIIAGMSHATIVIEAAEKSGALITAHHAIDMNRDLFALPGPITSDTSQGANRLIAKGAHPILNANTILEHYGHTTQLPLANQTPTFSDPLTAQIHQLCVIENQHPETVAQTLNIPIQNILTHLTMIQLSA